MPKGDKTQEIWLFARNVSRADTYAVLGDTMASGLTVKLEGLGMFYYTANTAKQGVESVGEVSAKQITGVRVRFIPETTRNSSNQVVTRSLVSNNIFFLFTKTEILIHISVISVTVFCLNCLILHCPT